jgi:hypothetical protein
MRRQRKRYNPILTLAAAAVLVAALGVVAFSSMVSASSTVIPAGFFTVSDVNGANDVPAQSDLTQMGRDDSDSTAYKLFWSWDSTDSWTSTGQTGDACSLFDYNANGRVDAVVCGQVHNLFTDLSKVVQNHAPYVFRCDDSKLDRCGQPSAAQSYATTDLSAGALGSPAATTSSGTGDQSNLVTDTDPFGASALNGPGSNYPNDTTLQVNVTKTYLATLAGKLGVKYPAIPSPTPTLVNVCSYPSAGNGGNNNPFDCIVAPGSGFLVIVKNSGTSPTTWAFGVGPTTALSTGEASSYNVTTAIPTGGTTATGSSSNIALTIGTNRTVTETGQTGWSLSSASCSYTDGTGAHTTGSLTGLAVSSITVASGRVTTCTFNNARDTGSILIQKTNGMDPLAGAAFTAQLGTDPAVNVPAVSGHTGLFCLDGLPTGGTYGIVESTTPTGYSGDANISSVTVSSASTCAARVAANATVDRTVANTRLVGSILIRKTDGTNDLAGAAFSATLSSASAGVSIPLVSGTALFCLGNLPTGGVYSITETTTPSGYAGTAIADVTVSTASTCAARVLAASSPDRTVTNNRLLGSIILKKTTSTGTALGGAAFTLTPVGGGTAIQMTEGNTGIFCTDGLPTGTSYTVAETTVPAGYNGAASIPDVTVAATGSTCTGRLATAFTPDSTVENAAAPGRINITKTDDRGLALGGAVFTLYQNTAPLASFDPLTDTVTEGQPQTTTVGGAASFTNVPLGEYCVVETTTPTGYATAAPQCFAVGLGGTAGTGQTIPLTFVNNRTHRVVVIVCHEGTDTLDPSEVTLGTTKTSLAAGTMTAAQQKALCDAGGASFGSLPHGTVAPSVVIASH